MNWFSFVSLDFGGRAGGIDARPAADCRPEGDTPGYACACAQPGKPYRVTPESKDLASTIAGGGAGISLLLTVRWEAIPHGECAKVAVALALVCLGYLMYRKPGQ